MSRRKDRPQRPPRIPQIETGGGLIPIFELKEDVEEHGWERAVRYEDVAAALAALPSEQRLAFLGDFAAWEGDMAWRGTSPEVYTPGAIVPSLPQAHARVAIERRLREEANILAAATPKCDERT